jgi:hypothetical protein
MNNWAMEDCLEIYATIAEKRMTWGKTILDLKGFRGNRYHGLCAICSKGVQGCGGISIWKGADFGKSVYESGWRNK